MTVTRDDVLHIAALARLAIPESKAPELVAQLNGILGHMDVLQGVDTSGAAALADSAAKLPMRADKGPPIPLLAPRESFAPAMRDGFFVVPRLATHEDEDAE